MDDTAQSLLTGVVMLALTVLGIVAALWVRRHRPARFNNARARTVAAVIMDIRGEPYATDTGPAYAALVSFTTRGLFAKQLTTEIRLPAIDAAPRIAPGYPPARVGDRIPVEYDQDHPFLARINDVAIPRIVPRRR